VDAKTKRLLEYANKVATDKNEVRFQAWRYMDPTQHVHFSSTAPTKMDGCKQNRLGQDVVVYPPSCV
jgi:hypothetical protein